MLFDYLEPKSGPVFKGLESEEIVYAKDQPQYIPLRALKGKGEFVPVLSRWTFTDEQREAIADGADIILELSTFGEPLQPIRIAITHDDVDIDFVNVSLLGKPVETLKVEVK